MQMDEPTAVIYANYSYEDYSGDSIVVYYDAGQYWLETGGHCSCYGLEGTWGPTSYDTKELFIECLKKSWRRNDLIIKLVTDFEAPLN